MSYLRSTSSALPLPLALAIIIPDQFLLGSKGSTVFWKVDQVRSLSHAKCKLLNIRFWLNCARATRRGESEEKKKKLQSEGSKDLDKQKREFWVNRRYIDLCYENRLFGIGSGAYALAGSVQVYIVKLAPTLICDRRVLR